MYHKPVKKTDDLLAMFYSFFFHLAAPQQIISNNYFIHWSRLLVKNNLLVSIMI
jgi:hypothetical protein